MRAIKLLLKTIIVVVILVVIAYFVITSQFFIRNVLLPLAGHQINGTVTVDSVKLAPLRGEIAFSNLNFDTENCKAKIKRFDCKFNLFAYFSDKISVSKFTLEDSFISIISKASANETPSEKEDNKSPSEVKLYNLDIQNVSIINFNLKYSVTRDNASADTVTELKKFNLAIPYFETSRKAKAEFTSTIVTSTANDTLNGFIQGKLNAVLNDKSLPKELLFDSSLTMGNETAPIYVKFDSTEEAGKTPFEMSAKLSNLPLQPFFQTFLSGSYQKTNGHIDNFDLSAKGPDLASVQNLNGVNGSLNLAVSNVYIPVEMANNPIVGLILLPLEIITSLNKTISSEAFNNLSSDIVGTSYGALNGKNIIEFKNGNINAVMTDGNTKINKFNFTGTQASAIKMMDMTGVINKDQSIDLNTKTSISGVIVPLHIKGTIKNPQADTVNLVNSMVQTTALTVGNIINAAGGKENVTNTANSIINAVDSYTGNSSQDNSGASVGDFINNIKGFSK